MAIGIIIIDSELLSGKRRDGHLDVRLSCLPHMSGDYRETELGVRAQAQAAQLAQLWLCDALSKAGFAFKEGGR